MTALELAHILVTQSKRRELEIESSGGEYAPKPVLCVWIDGDGKIVLDSNLQRLDNWCKKIIYPAEPKKPRGPLPSVSDPPDKVQP